MFALETFPLPDLEQATVQLELSFAIGYYPSPFTFTPAIGLRRMNRIVDEGRSFLWNLDKQYDIIQMYSNHTSSRIVIGGIASVIISIYLGFNLTLLTAALIYALALAFFMRMRQVQEAIV